MRISIRKLAFWSVLSAFSVALTSLIYLYFPFDYIDSIQKYIIDGDANYEKVDEQARRTLYHGQYKFGHYKDFLKSLQKKPAHFKKEPLNERCKAFFDYLESSEPSWGLSKDKKINYDKDVLNKKKFFDDRIKKLKEGYNSEKRSEDIEASHATEEDLINITKEFEEAVRNTQVAEQNMADTIAIMRLYGKCFLEQTNNSDPKILELFGTYTNKIFPFMNGMLPTFTRYDGEVIEEGFPIYDNTNYTHETHKYNDNKFNNIISFMKSKSNGRGIVLSAASTHTKDLVKLIRVLRALNNELPIQIMYKGDLSSRSIKYITFSARADVDLLLNPKNLYESDKVQPELDLLRDFQSYGSNFPKQDIWFVNIMPAIHRNYKYVFDGFYNKVLALLFNSFEEVMMLDVDVVPLIPVNDFFKMNEYLNSKAYFFKDRSLRDTNSFIETNLFMKFFPLKRKDSIDELFNIPSLEHILDNKYMQGWRHYQESGMVLMNKISHFMGVLMMVPLVIWRNPVKSSIWGDKEMFWLGLSMAGDESYHFNRFPVAGVGQLSLEKHKLYIGTETNEICSSHPGHVDQEGRLLWINSGFSYCKKNGHYRDKDTFPFSTYNITDLAILYNSPLYIRNSLVPPDLPPFRDVMSLGSIKKEKATESYWKHNKKDMDDLEKDKPDQLKDMLPHKGWVKTGVCKSYHYCSYDVVQSYEDQRIIWKGRVFNYTENLTNFYDYIGKVWTTGKSRVSLENV